MALSTISLIRRIGCPYGTSASDAIAVYIMA